MEKNKYSDTLNIRRGNHNIEMKDYHRRTENFLKQNQQQKYQQKNRNLVRSHSKILQNILKMNMEENKQIKAMGKETDDNS